MITVATRESLASVPLHPATVLVGLMIQWGAFFRIRTGKRAGWKGRLYPVG
jgi:hypothetical protein